MDDKIVTSDKGRPYLQQKDGRAFPLIAGRPKRKVNKFWKKGRFSRLRRPAKQIEQTRIRNRIRTPDTEEKEQVPYDPAAEPEKTGIPYTGEELKKWSRPRLLELAESSGIEEIEGKPLEKATKAMLVKALTGTDGSDADS